MEEYTVLESRKVQHNSPQTDPCLMHFPLKPQEGVCRQRQAYPRVYMEKERTRIVKIAKLLKIKHNMKEITLPDVKAYLLPIRKNVGYWQRDRLIEQTKESRNRPIKICPTDF